MLRSQMEVSIPPVHTSLNPCCLAGEVILVRQTDQPGIIAAVSTELAKNAINISYITVSRTGNGCDAIMAIGVDVRPAAEVLAAVGRVAGVQECTSFTEQKA